MVELHGVALLSCNLQHVDVRSAPRPRRSDLGPRWGGERNTCSDEL